MTHLDAGVWDKAYSYAEYRQLIDALMAQHKTTGHNHAADMLEYTRMNVVRMNRLDKSNKLNPNSLDALAQIQRPLHWLTITEGWCGDAAQIVPVIAQMADACPAATHKIILRDEHPEVIDAFLTNGGRAIPVVVILDAQTQEVLGHWGPRPKDAQAIMTEAKARMALLAEDEEKESVFHQAKVDLQKWYAADKSNGIQQEFLATLSEVIQYEDVALG